MRDQVQADAGDRHRGRFPVLRPREADIERAVLEVEHGGGVVELGEAAAAVGAQAEGVRTDAHFVAAVAAGVQPGARADDVVDDGAIPLPGRAVFLGAPDLGVAVGHRDAAGDQRRLAGRALRVGGRRRGAAGEHEGDDHCEPALHGLSSDLLHGGTNGRPAPRVDSGNTL
jgi:hypothetical protein